MPPRSQKGITPQAGCLDAASVVSKSIYRFLKYWS